MTDTTDTEGKMYSLAINAPQPLNITFTDGSQLIFPVSGKASFTGDVEESARVFFDAVIRHRDSQLEAERQRSAGSEEELHKALHREKAAERKLLAAQEEIAALKTDIESCVGICSELATEVEALKGDQVPVYQVEADVKKDSENNLISMTWADVSKEQAEISQDDYGLLIRVLFTTPQNPVVLPVADHETEDGYKYYREETVKAAIEAAGGIVKGGE